MTNTEKNALWIKEQRKKITKEINEIMFILVEQNLSESIKKYDINFHFTMSGNQFEIRIYDVKLNEQVEHLDYWGLERILNVNPFIFDKTQIEKNVKEAILKIRKMKNLAKKYAEINDKGSN